VKARRPKPALAELMLIASKLYRDQPLSYGERASLGVLIDTIASDQDVRADYWESITNRPMGKDAAHKINAAMDIALDDADGVKLAAAMREAQDAWQLTSEQVKHAWRDYGAGSKELLTKFPPAFLRKRQEWLRAKIKGGK
jgi:hypothetical protein